MVRFGTLAHCPSSAGIADAARDFSRCRSGSVAISFALVAIVLLAVAGIAIDTARAYRAANSLAGAVDAAALAAVKAMQEDGLDDAALRDIARDVIELNARSRGADVTVQNLDLVSNRTTGALRVQVAATVPTTMAQIINVETIELSRSASVVYNPRDVELSLMLDVTGSMCNPCTKIDDLKLAAKDLVGIMLAPDRPSAISTRIALVPFSGAVNVGAMAAAVTNGTAPNSCVVERAGSQAFTNASPLSHPLVGQTDAQRASKKCPSAEVLPLTDDKTALEARIDSFSTNGFTAGHLGTAWAWYMISPEWASLLPAESQPAAHDTQERIKAVILMTDGEFNTQYAAGNGNSANQAKQLCEKMKADGVVVYTVGFLLSQANAIQTLEDCSTDKTTHHFLAENGEELRSTFRTIARRLTKIALTQ